VNGPDALIGAVRYDAGIVHVAVRRMQSCGRQRKLAAPLIRPRMAPKQAGQMPQPSWLRSPKIRAFVDYPAEQWGRIDAFRTPSTVS
jgi:hypothetical protein